MIIVSHFGVKKKHKLFSSSCNRRVSIHSTSVDLLSMNVISGLHTPRHRNNNKFGSQSDCVRAVVRTRYVNCRTPHTHQPWTVSEFRRSIVLQQSLSYVLMWGGGGRMERVMGKWWWRPTLDESGFLGSPCLVHLISRLTRTSDVVRQDTSRLLYTSENFEKFYQ